MSEEKKEKREDCERAVFSFCFGKEERKKVKTLKHSTLEHSTGWGTPGTGEKGGPAGFQGCDSDAAIECFCGCKWSEMPLGAGVWPVRCSVNRTTMFWPNGDISIT